MESIEAILIAGASATGLGEPNPCVGIIDEAGGLDKIENLQNHPNEQIYAKVRATCITKTHLPTQAATSLKPHYMMSLYMHTCITLYSIHVYTTLYARVHRTLHTHPLHSSHHLYLNQAATILEQHFGATDEEDVLLAPAVGEQGYSFGTDAQPPQGYSFMAGPA